MIDNLYPNHNILVDSCFWYALFDCSDEYYLKAQETTFLVPDIEYREQALSNTFFYSLEQKRPMALVDMSIRLMLEDVNLNVTTLMTFNVGDFVDVCASKRIELISE